MFFAQSWYFTNQILGIYLMECKITDLYPNTISFQYKDQEEKS